MRQQLRYLLIDHLFVLFLQYCTLAVCTRFGTLSIAVAARAGVPGRPAVSHAPAVRIDSSNDLNHDEKSRDHDER